jgi:arylsulfatase A-like enzyme
MTRARFIVGLWILAAGACSSAPKPPAGSPPNILFIYSDDQSHRTVGCYPEAYPWVRTPNIDRLARRGVRFAHAYIGTWCMPSRATLLTGRHPWGVESMRQLEPYPAGTYDPARCPFWPRVFREKGYVTAQIGKWHTGTDTGFGRDWDYQVVWNRPGHPENSTHYYGDQLLSTNGGPPERFQGYTTDHYTDLAVDFIRGGNRAPGKPWYLWLCYGAAHGPYTPAERHRQAHPEAAVPVPADIYPPRPGKPAYMQKVESWVRGQDGQPVLKSTARGKAKTLTEAVRQYQQTVLALDEGIGRVIDAVGRSGQEGRTLVVFTSDQGFAWGQHGFAAKSAPYDANLRAPLIVSMPGALPEGAVCERPVGGADLVPTFFRFAGIDLPSRMDGHDLTPLLRRPSAEWPHPVLIAFTGGTFGSDTARLPEVEPAPIPWWVFLRSGRHKYIRTLVAGEIEELYDLEADPEELANLAPDPGHAARLAGLREALVAEMRRTGAALADRLPPVR